MRDDGNEEGRNEEAESCNLKVAKATSRGGKASEDCTAMLRKDVAF